MRHKKSGREVPAKSMNKLSFGDKKKMKIVVRRYAARRNVPAYFNELEAVLAPTQKGWIKLLFDFSLVWG